jgi:CubicO group peptidase (beta-lactamase class C family)
MKKKAYLIAAVCSVCVGTSSVLAESGSAPIPSIEKQEKHASLTAQPPHPIFTWNSDKIPVTSVLHPGSARGAGMVEAPLQKIDGIINQAITDHVMPGAVVLVARGGTIVKEEAYGYSARYSDGSFTEMENPIMMQKDTIFDLASISKLFTSTAVMMLYEKGLFGLDDPVARYIPEFAQNRKQQVTIRQLLTHTSGFPAWIPLYTKGTSRDERLQIVFNQPLTNSPGSTYTYSDLNMITLGALVERLSGQREDQFVKEHITGPLGMNDTMYNPPASLKNRIAATEYQTTPNRGLVWGQVHDENAWSLDGVAGHAGVFSTAEDLAKFAHIFLNDGRYAGKTILQPETVNLLLENQNKGFPGDDHGLGWELNQGWYMDALSDGTAFGHTGYTGTSIVVSQLNKTIAILLTNRVHPSRNTVSTNQTRRLVARQVADSIPVTMPSKEPAWFAGYGDRLNRTMETDLNLKQDSTLSYSTWYSLENGSDFGYIEVFKEGSWQRLEQLTGNSTGWEMKELTIPKEAVKLRFVYKTDSSVNGRGWYIQNPYLDDESGIQLNFSSNDWQLRNY